MTLRWLTCGLDRLVNTSNIDAIYIDTEYSCRGETEYGIYCDLNNKKELIEICESSEKAYERIDELEQELNG